MSVELYKLFHNKYRQSYLLRR